MGAMVMNRLGTCLAVLLLAGMAAGICPAPAAAADSGDDAMRTLRARLYDSILDSMRRTIWPGTTGTEGRIYAGKSSYDAFRAVDAPLRLLAVCLDWNAKRLEDVSSGLIDMAWRHNSSRRGRLQRFLLNNCNSRYHDQPCKCEIVSVNGETVLEIPQAFAARMRETPPANAVTPASAPEAVAPQPVNRKPPAASAAAPAAAADPYELAFWDTVKDSADPAQYRAYLEAYPDGRFVPLAQVLIARHKDAAQQAATPPAPDIDFGRYHALVIGNNAYRHVTPLRTASRDARAVAAMLRDNYGFAVELLVDATRHDILAAISHLRAQLTADDNLLIYYAGHGVLDEAAQSGYWLPVDAERDNVANWIANHDLTANIRAMSARHVMVVADSCYSGSLMRAAVGITLGTGREQAAWLKRLAEKRSRTVLTSGGVEPVLDAGGGEHSVFAKAFLDALRDNAGVLDGHGLFARLQRNVVVNAEQTPGYADIRRAGHEGGDFLFVRQ